MRHERTAAPVGVTRWPATLAVLVVGALDGLLAAHQPGRPPWLLLACSVALLVPSWLARRAGRDDVAHALTLLLNSVLTLALIATTALLLFRMGQGRAQSLDLLRDAALLWVADIVVFALWSWSLDGGGPAQRHRGGHASTDIAFPQQQRAADGIASGWSPAFLDYLFLAFTAATVFGPAQTPILSRRLKLTLMTEAVIALACAVLAARAIVTLSS